MTEAAFMALLSAICWVESKHTPAAINVVDGGSASYGECQVKLKTARYMGFKGHPSQLLKREVNREFAGKYLRYQLARYDGDVRMAVSAYNAGRVRGEIRNHKYVNRVMSKWRTQ
jgi:soluble lytic murein transglycosylase-like protein